MLIKGIFIPRSIRLNVEGDTTPPGGATDLSKVLESFNNKLAKFNNDATALAQQLFTENYTLREDKRKLNARVEELQGKQPAEGAVVLTGDEAKTWGAIKELNLSADDIKAKLQSSTETAAELSRLKRQSLIREAAETEGYKHTVLDTLIGADMPLELKEVDKDGKKVKQAFVKVDEQELSLSDYITTHKADFLPALKVETGNGNKFVRQDSSGKAPAANPYDRIREETKARQEAQKKDDKSLGQRLGMA